MSPFTILRVKSHLNGRQFLFEHALEAAQASTTIKIELRYLELRLKGPQERAPGGVLENLSPLLNGISS